MITFIAYYLALQSCVSTKGNCVIMGEGRKLEERIFPTYSLALRILIVSRILARRQEHISSPISSCTYIQIFANVS